MNTEYLLEVIPFKKVRGVIPTTISGIEVDSRVVARNNMFVCIEGDVNDGHDYISNAYEKGARLFLSEKAVELPGNDAGLVIVKNTKDALSKIASRYYKYPSSDMCVIGVTGTNGKTTVTQILNSTLRKLGVKTGVSGTIGFDIDGEKVESQNTTSDSLTTQKMLGLMRDKGITDSIMEVSSHGLSLGRLSGVDFDIGVFTNLSQDHLDFHKTMDEYGHAKGLLFSQMGQDLKKKKFAILNADDPWSKKYENVTSAHVITYGIKNNSDFKAVDIEYTQHGTSFTLLAMDRAYRVDSPLIGEFNVSNLLAVMATLFVKGYELEDIILGVKDGPSVPGRMELVKSSDGVDFYVDYAHTPDAIEKVLSSVKPLVKEKLIVLIGAGGNRDIAKRPKMATSASKWADYVIITTDNPRYESSQSIMEDIEDGMTHGNYALIADRREAINEAIRQAEKGDIVIIAGKGHENFQIIKDEKYPFSDSAVIGDYFI